MATDRQTYAHRHHLKPLHTNNRPNSNMRTTAVKTNPQMTKKQLKITLVNDQTLIITDMQNSNFVSCPGLGSVVK